MPRGIRNFAIFAIALLSSWIIGANVAPTWTVERTELDVKTDDDGKLYYIYREKPAHFEAVPMAQAQLDPAKIEGSRTPRRSLKNCLCGGDRPLLQTGGQAPLELLVAFASGGGRAVVLADQRTGHLAIGWHHLRCSPYGPLRLHRRCVDPLVGDQKRSWSSAALLVAVGWADGDMVAHGGGSGFCRVYDRALCARPQKRQASRLAARGRLLPRRHRQHGAGRHYG